VNLAEDISERTNFASQYPDIVQRLTGLHNDWLEDVESER